MTLTTQQEQVLALISAGSTIADAAQSAGIHRNTIHNWLRSAPEFQQALDQARQAKALYWQEQAEQLAADALATIRTLMTDPKTPAATRLRAAQIILNLATNPPKNMPKNVHKSAQPIPEPEPGVGWDFETRQDWTTLSKWRRDVQEKAAEQASHGRF